MTQETEPTTTPPPGQETGELPVNTSGGWNIPGDVVAAGIEKCPKEFRDELRFAYEYAHNQGWSMREAAERFQVDISTFSRLLNGKYLNVGKTPLPPPNSMLSVVREIRAELEEAKFTRETLVRDHTTESIWLLCDKTRDQRTISFLYGESHLGKTTPSLAYKDAHNHGLSLYVDLQDCNGVQDVWRAFARALHLSADCPAYKLIPRIYKALKPDGIAKPNRFIIVDEFHSITYAYLKGSSVRIINVLKAIHDKTGVPMLVIGTPTARDEIVAGKERQYLKQIRRRGVLELILPPAIPVRDIRAWAEFYRLDFPTTSEIEHKVRKFVGREIKADEVDNDDWKNLKLAFPDSQHLLDLEDISWNHGKKRLRCTFEDAKILAKNARRELRWADFEKANRIYTKFATPIKV